MSLTTHTHPCCKTSLWYLLGVTLRLTPLSWFDKVWKFFCTLKCNCAVNIWTKWEFVLFNNCNYVWTMVWVPLFTKKLLWQCVTNWPHISPSLVYNCSQDGHLIRQFQHLKKNIFIFETGCAIPGSSDIWSFYTSSCSSFPFRSFIRIHRSENVIALCWVPLGGRIFHI